MRESHKQTPITKVYISDTNTQIYYILTVTLYAGLFTNTSLAYGTYTNYVCGPS